ncbi:hypothetical protein EDB86DRAFT_2829227 [Lactarius hatsudake]|nr:hypothetical protein EDB86DRAFT_2829227 [Lactarius hatsudake]
MCPPYSWKNNETAMVKRLTIALGVVSLKVIWYIMSLWTLYPAANPACQWAITFPHHAQPPLCTDIVLESGDIASGGLGRMPQISRGRCEHRQLNIGARPDAEERAINM